MASTYLSRSISTTGDTQTATISFWVKRAAIASGSDYTMFSTGSANTDDFSIFFDGHTSGVLSRHSSSTVIYLATDRLFRDTSAWYHIVVEVDTTQATESNRVKFYVNGVQETSFSTETYPSQNQNLRINESGYTNYVGNLRGSSNYFDGSMAHFHLIDGTAYDASTFGQTDATTGIWSPKTAPSVTYGTNGFFLKFENSGSMGTDSSGNGNNFTVNGTLTQTVDTPSNVFPTFNPLDVFNTGGRSFSNGNLTLTQANATGQGRSTLAVSKGKYYAEFKLTSVGSGTAFGVGKYEANGGIFANSTDGSILNGSGSLSGGSILVNDIIGVALDATSQTIKWYINNTLEATYDYSSNSQLNDSEALCFMGAGSSTSGTNVYSVNFGNGFFGTTQISSPSSDENGNGLFTYAPPTGYLALCTKSINSQEYS